MHHAPHTTAVVGLQWGDEGKGKIVDVLTAGHDVIVRYNGGANAGHTVVVGDQRYALHLIPSGILYPDKSCVIGNGVVVDPEKLIQEMEGLEARGIAVGTNLVISDRAHVVMPYHKEQDAALEEYLSGMTAGERGNLSIGTTRRGIGPAYADKIHRSTAIRMGDLLDEDYLASRLEVICRLRTEELKALGVQAPPLDPAALTARYAALGERLRPHIKDTVYHLHDCQRAGKRLLFEGANACLLDIDHGTYPYVTSSNCSTAGIHSGTGISGRSLQRVIGIMKAYSTRVGAGPFPTELLNQIGSTIRERGREYGTTTGRPRRCGWLDLVAVRYSAMVCGATEIACTLFDVLTGFDELRICTHYRLADGTVTDRFIPDAKRLEGATPVYSTFRGWTEQVSDLPDRAALPQAARDYLDAVEQHVGVPVSMVSVGPERTQTLVGA
ncbi:MAG: adenylosuccinate synthase [Planctomycetes bacterium]|nr:adenylosuccinate synthase [Planctomycetota bacterium]